MRYLKKANAGLLAFICFRWCCVTWSMQIVEENESQDEEIFRQQVKRLRNYEVTVPSIFNAGDLHGSDAGSTVFQIAAFGNSYDIVVKKSANNSNLNTYVEYFGKNNTYEAKYMKEDKCFYSGTITSAFSDSFEAILNYCNGIEGMIETNDALIFIEPVKYQKSSKKMFHQQHIVYRSEDVILKTNNDVLKEEVINAPLITKQRRFRRATGRASQSFLTFINRAGRTVQLFYLDLYKTHIPFISFVINERRSINSYKGTVWIAKDDATDQLLLLNGKTEYIADANKPNKRALVIMTKPENMVFPDSNNVDTISNNVNGDNYYIEVMVVADESVVSFHGRDRIERYILTMMDIAAHVFQHKSLKMKIDFKVVRILLIENNQGGFTVYKKNPTKTLRSACKYISSLKNHNENHPNHFDFGIALTRKDFGPSGFAQLYSMCSSRRSCVLVQDEGLTSAFIVAHETAHLLGLEHDGEGEASRCSTDGPKGSIMAPVIQATYTRFRWSNCSRDVLKENIEYFHCLLNKPKQRFKQTQYGRHGALYTLSEQCQFIFDKSFSICTSFTHNPCRLLWCSGRDADYCKTMRGPALEGTICGRNKHCIKGDCQMQSNRINAGSSNMDKPKVVNGNWGSWVKWSPCSRSCDVGIRTRTRKCDNPVPSTKGKPCKGDGLERNVCNKKQCDINKSIHTLQVEQCMAVNGKDWTVYSDKAFAGRFQLPRRNLNCSFESGLCNWANDGPKNKINWRINSGTTLSYSTGPSADHTYGNSRGKYIYLEASSTKKHTKKEGDVSRLVSPFIGIPRICFTMYYHMFGQNMGQMRLKILRGNGREDTLWTKSGNRGDKWHKLQMNYEDTRRYKIVLEAVRGGHWASDVALDDISVTAGFCPSQKRARNQCKVSCRSRDARQFQMNIDVTDGVRCEDDSHSSDICLAGRCVKFGCDYKFDSDLVVDNCGVCGGNGSSCLRVAGRKEISPIKDYESLLLLPKGSTFINLTHDTPSSYYLGIRKPANNLTYLNTKSEEYYVINDSTFHFKTQSDGKQMVFSKGPISEGLDIVLYSYPSNRKTMVALQYQYYKPAVVEFDYKFNISGWKPCSRTCGTGKQMSTVSCIRLQDGISVEASFCKGLNRPLYMRSCRLQSCPRQYKWKIERWSQCSKTCGGGFKRSIPSCVDLKRNVKVGKHLCTSKVPRYTRKCRTNRCPKIFKWHTGNWGICSRTCGEGLRKRVVMCIDQNMNKLADDNKCKHSEKPDTFEPCGTQMCETYVYIVEREGVCSKSCGGGLKVQIVFCVKERTKEKVKGLYCNGPSPPRIARCNEQKCPEFSWKVEESSPCSKTCGNGTISREIICVNMENMKKADGKNCLGKKLVEVVPCFQKKCVTYGFEYSTWGKCSATCGIGVQKRTMVCKEKYSRKSVPNRLCGRSVRLERVCSQSPCLKADKLYCDFDRRTFCYWKNTKNDDFNWSIGKRTPSLNTGPIADHTTKQGYFAYIEASSPRKMGERAILMSPFIKVASGCLSFWYHMKGTYMGRLRVLLTSEKSNRLLFEKNGRQGRYWLQARVSFKHKGAYRLMFEAAVGSGVYSDVAIDDISFQSKTCDETVQQLKTRKPCREISPYCRHGKRAQYCKTSPAYRDLCCKTCANLSDNKPNVKVVEFRKKN